MRRTCRNYKAGPSSHGLQPTAIWAGLAPGDNESAGKRKKAPAGQGNRQLRTAMVEAA